MTMKQVNLEQAFLGTAASTVVTKVAIEAFPELRPLEPIAQVLTILFLLLLTAELLRQLAH